MTKFKGKGWALKASNGKFLNYLEVGYFEEIGPAILATRKLARQINKNSFCSQYKVVKVEVQIKEAA